MDGEINKTLSEIYYNESNPAGYSSVEKLYLAAGKKFTRTEVKDWLSSQKVYTLHRPKRRYFARQRVIATAVDDVWQADLVEMLMFKKENKGYGYILTMVDVLSKFAFAVAVSSKKGKEVAAAFESVFKDRSPAHLQTDQGKEFLNDEVQSVMKGYGVSFYTTKDADIKCSLVERFNRTLRSRMFRYFTRKGSHFYLDVLPRLVTAYNNTVHSAIGVAPVDATDSKYLFQKLYGFASKREMMLRAGNTDNTIPVGSTVRIKYKENLMDKGYYPSWTDELFTVAKVIKGTRPMYILRDYENEIIDGRFYKEEIQLVKEDTYRITVLRTRTRNGRKECLVHWIGYPDSQNKWIPESEIVDD